MSRMQEYGELVSAGSGIWIREGEWYESVFRRRMTVMALQNGDVLVHNPFVMKDADLKSLQTLGKRVGLVVPNALHGDEAGGMASRLKELGSEVQVWVPAAMVKKVEKQCKVQGTLENDWPTAWAESVKCLPVQGLRIIHESVFFHQISRTLVVTDLVFNMEPRDFRSNLERTLMRWNRVGQGLGPSWLCDHLFTRDLKARQRSLEEILSWDFDRVVMNHGHVVHQGGKKLMKQAFGIL